jgi:hypothetical protein
MGRPSSFSEVDPDRETVGAACSGVVRVPVDIMSTPGLGDEERVAILGGTAAKLLDIES